MEKNNQNILNKIFESNTSGRFKVLSKSKNKTKLGKSLWNIQFVDTGTIINDVQLNNLKSGSVFDPYMRRIESVGFIGVGQFKSTTHKKAYQTWIDMLKRCYSSERHERQPTYKDCSVCDEWHNFQNYAEWHSKNYVEGFQLDKDKKCKNNKIYSPDTCCFISQEENAIIANAKSYKFLSPENKLVEVFNLNKFSKENNLDVSTLSKVAKGIHTQHKGWKHVPVKNIKSSNKQCSKEPIS